MRDTHVHIGQFYDKYYEPQKILDIVHEAGVEEIWHSSTTTCVKDVKYTTVEKEIASVCAINKYQAYPALWYIPDYISQGVLIETALHNLPYRGIKLHPKAHHWDFENAAHINTLHEIFDCAENGTSDYILIHIGDDTVQETEDLSRFFAKYPHAKVILAHCRPLEQTLRLMSQYKNVGCDTAFVEKNTVQKIIEAGFAGRIHTGSDFPITHYFRTTYPRPGENPDISLEDKYTEDSALLKLYTRIVVNES
jgi:predicted TIM-barrel fold metal-dependent hydrolase